jgi:hypothetical protein
VSVLALALCLVAAARSIAQPAKPAAPPTTGIIEGLVTTQAGTVRLAGALVTLRDATGQDLSAVPADGDGHFRFVDLPPGVYQVGAALDGFDARAAKVSVVAGKMIDSSLDLPIAGVAEHVEVSAPSGGVTSSDTLSGTEQLKSREMEQLAPCGFSRACCRCPTASASRGDGLISRASSLARRRSSTPRRA